MRCWNRWRAYEVDQQQVQGPEGRWCTFIQPEMRWVLGAKPAYSHMPFSFSFTCSALIGCWSCRLLWQWRAPAAPPPSHHLDTFPNFISTMGPNVGLTSAWLTQLAHVSTVVHAFHRLSHAFGGALAGHFCWRSFQTDSNREEFEFLARRAFSVAVIKIIKFSVCLELAFDPQHSPFTSGEALPIHLAFHEAYFSLVSLVRAEWDRPGTEPRWWRFTEWPSCKYLTVLWCCPCQMSALNNSDYTSRSLHSWRNRSMLRSNTAATLVIFSCLPFEESFFKMGWLDLINLPIVHSVFI